MYCSFHQQEICRSCSQLHLEYTQTLQIKRDKLCELFAGVSVDDFPKKETAEGNRIRARLAVTGTLEEPVIGFFDDQQKVVPVTQCPLHYPLINTWVRGLPELIRAARLTPYDVSTDRGELKFVVLTCSPSSQQLMVQFVLRSREAVDRIRSLWRRMSETEKSLVPVMSINLQPAKSSVIMGMEELSVSDQTFLPIRFGERELLYGPQSFLQTNYEAAVSLYSAAGQILQSIRAENVLDLYCGVGAFSLSAGAGAVSILGIDVSADAIACANEAVQRNKIDNAEYQCRSLECTTVGQLNGQCFDTVICNPPRRGLDAGSISLMKALKPRHIMYSSCNATTLHRDWKLLADDYEMQALQPVDMFPFTHHFEVLAVLKRRTEIV